MKKNLLPKTASQRAIAGLTSLALVAGGLTVMPYAGAQDEPAEPVVAAAEPNNDAAAEEAAPAEAAARNSSLHNCGCRRPYLAAMDRYRSQGKAYYLLHQLEPHLSGRSQSRI